MYLIISQYKEKRNPSVAALEQHVKCVISGHIWDCDNQGFCALSKSFHRQREQGDVGMINKIDTDSKLPTLLSKPEFTTGPLPWKGLQEHQRIYANEKSEKSKWLVKVTQSGCNAQLHSSQQHRQDSHPWFGPSLSKSHVWIQPHPLGEKDINRPMRT